jgi:hypothetical protein
MPGSERPPENWPGWPDRKKFAVVLTHDVERQRGLDHVKQLADLEMKLGFRSSFNLVPEGEYTVSPDLRNWLIDRDFEVGVHDLNHDGKLYSSRSGFMRKAERINQHLRDWNALGFRSGFMLHNLDWLAALDVHYDASTFDTDPFEPQPDGVGTIFPFWVPAPAARQPGVRCQKSGGLSTSETLNSQPLVAPESGEGGSTINHPRGGYVELPYTLPQDSTLFLLLREESSAIWKRKLDWVADKGGMALMNVHPDYMSFVEAPERGHVFNASLYSEFLEYVKQTYGDSFWSALPREIARHVADAYRK